MRFTQRNSQQTFTHIWNTFVKRRRGPGYNKENKACVYHTPDGKAGCAIGVCIPKGHSAGNTDGGVSTLFAQNPDLRSKMFTDDVSTSLLERLQTAHDYAANPKTYGGTNWSQAKSFLARIRENLTKVATEFNLTIPA